MFLSKVRFTILGSLLTMTCGLPLGIGVVQANEDITQVQEYSLDSTAAVVNSDIILTSELDAATALVEKNFKARGANVDPIDARRAALEELITRSVILQMGKQQGFNLTDTQINLALNQAAMTSNTTVEAILKSYGLKSEGAARERFAEDLIINEVRQNQIRRRIRIADTEVDLLAKSLREIGNVEPSYHIAQIILPLDARASYNQVNKVTALANQIKAESRKGADFNALAAKYSQGSEASQGGDLGYVLESQVPVPFLPALLKAKEGDVVGPFRSPYGLHLIKLFDVTNQAVEPITTYKAKHILLTTSVVFSDDAAYSQLSALRRQILNGVISFADAAKKYSEDPGSASLGGELGYAPASRYDPGFARGLISLQKGQISEPIKSSFGWHLILLEDRKIDKDSQEAYQQRARELIYKRAYAIENQAWEREIRKTAFVQVKDKALLNANLQHTIDSEDANIVKQQ